MKLTLDITASNGVFTISKSHPLAPWIVTVRGEARSCYGSKARAIAVGEAMLAEIDVEPEATSGFLF